MISTRVLLLLVLTSCAYGHIILREEQEQHDHSVGIAGGHTISIKQAPFMASIRIDDIGLWCGGSIIHERFILTTAQCVTSSRDGFLTVSVGSNNLEEGGKFYGVVKTMLHDQYSNKTGNYDAALLKLNESLTFGPTVSRVLLKGNLVKVKLGTMLNITGWGGKDSNYEVSNLLQQTTVPVVSNKKCEEFFKGLKLTNRMMCTEEINKYPCLFDDGGPLTYNNVQIGIITMHFGCGQSPSLYTRVKTINQWIKKTIRINLNEKEN